MVFAFDFDNTFDRDPVLFREIIDAMHRRGHTAIVVTTRFAGVNDEVERTVGDIPVVYAGDVWKRQAARAAGFTVNVWIDDLPEYVDEQDPELAAQKKQAEG